ncbi:MAG: carboxypeptidase regulatory-like domain-containing protein [Planctomycetota bacterium]
MPALALLLSLATSIWPQDPPPETVTLSGRVVDLRGEGVPVAEVWVTHQTDERLARTVTDAEGFFRVGKVPKRPWWNVWAKAEGRCVGRDFTRSLTAPLHVLLHDATRVSGLITNRDGEPLPGVPVAAQTTGRVSFHIESVTSDAQGRFTFDAMPLGPAAFSAWVPELGLLLVQHRVIGDDAVALRPLDTPSTSMTISIDGLPKDGRPEVTLAWLPYSGGSLSYLPGPMRQPMLTTDQWQAEHIPDWRYLVRLQATGWSFEPNQVTVEAGKGPHQLGFVAHRLGDTSLLWPAVVRDGEGTPVAGVSLVMRRSNGGEQAEATSDEHGKLQFDTPFAASTKVVVYSTHQHWTIDQTKVDAVPGMRDRRTLGWHEGSLAPGQPLELRVVPACSVTGTLLLADGRPAAGVNVQLEDESANRWPRWVGFTSTTTDLAGKYHFPGQHQSADAIRVHVAGRSGNVDSEAFVLDAPGTKINVPPLELSPIAIVEGVVLGADGKPAPGVAVWLREWDLANNNQRSGSVTEVITDRQGRYRFVGVPLGGAYLEIPWRRGRDIRRAVEPFDVEAGKTYAFELRHEDQ